MLSSCRLLNSLIESKLFINVFSLLVPSNNLVYLQATVSSLKPRVTFEQKKRMILLKENTEIKQRTEFLDKQMKKQDGEAVMIFFFFLF